MFSCTQHNIYNFNVVNTTEHLQIYKWKCLLWTTGNRIHISTSTYQSLKKHAIYIMQERGRIAVKVSTFVCAFIIKVYASLVILYFTTATYTKRERGERERERGRERGRESFESLRERGEGEEREGERGGRLFES